MKLLHVAPAYLPAHRYGGPVASVHGLATALAGRGHEVHVFTTDADGPDRLDVPTGAPVDVDGLRVTYFPVAFPRRVFRAPDMAAALARDARGFDLVHVHGCFQWPTTAAARAAERAGVPLVLSPRGMLVRELIQQRSRLKKSAWIRLFDRHTVERAALVHATSERERRDVEALGWRLPEVAVIPNGVEYPGPADAAGAPSPEIERLLARGDTLLYLGRLSWKKGLDRLIAALATVPGAPLVLAGPDDEDLRPALLRLAREHGVEDRVHFPGLVSGADKAALLARAALVVLPSLHENLGNVVLEAMAVGTPAAVTEGVGAVEILRAARAGVVLPDDPAGMGRALATTLADPELRRDMGERGRRAAHDLRWEAVATRMEEAYACCGAGVDSSRRTNSHSTAKAEA
jgi:glycosyltransferase involved in cell wall biosynthesis